MFYSQFILAKKGPLGTIWIAAHLERKLRKNQVADTDIGDSVDSILFPDVPIALRLSSHLLLGVVRIYSRKVNYLFDDCSEALLKIKQAFRSTAVDLPPEQSKAPYHSITLPETFDLDDFELPDNDIFQGNYVDHHVSSREQITLQDNMTGIYSTSQFGLDERFGDGDTSQVGLDLEEDILLGKANMSEADPQASTEPAFCMETDANDDEMDVSAQDMPVNGTTNKNIGVVTTSEAIEYAQAPSTPILIGEPNLSSAQESLACDDNLESEYQITELGVEGTHKASRKMNHQHGNDIADLSSGAHLNHDNDVCMVNKENGHPGHFQSTETIESISANGIDGRQEDCSAKVENVINGDGKQMDGECVDSEDGRLLQTDEVKVGNETGKLHSQNEAVNALEFPVASEFADLACQVHHDPGIPGTSGNHFDSEQAPSNSVPVLRACNSQITHPEENQILEPTDNGQIPADDGVFDERLDRAITTANQLENQNASETSELPEPEKLLSIPQTHSDNAEEWLVESTEKEDTGEFDKNHDSYRLSGKKRNLPDSSLTTPSLNSGESFEMTRSKKTVDLIPGDDDLLSSILAGRKSTVLKMKPTPAPDEVSLKRRRPASRSSAVKRKVPMDDSMVLHGDTIRQQLINTEDIRRQRKKAPCTQIEVLLIQRQFLEEELFNEPVLTGVSEEITCLHNKTFDFSNVRISDNVDSLELTKDKEFSYSPTAIQYTNMEISTQPVVRDDNVAQVDQTSTQNENHHEIDETLGSPTACNLENINSNGRIVDQETMDYEALPCVCETGTNGNTELADAVNPSTVLRGDTSQTEPLCEEISHLPTDSHTQSALLDQNTNADASLLMDGLARQSDTTNVNDSDRSNIGKRVDGGGVNDNSENIEKIETASIANAGILSEETDDTGRTGERGTDAQVNVEQADADYGNEIGGRVDQNLLDIEDAQEYNGDDKLGVGNNDEDPSMRFLYDDKEQILTDLCDEETRFDASCSAALDGNVEIASLADGGHPLFDHDRYLDAECASFNHFAEGAQDFEFANDTDFLNFDEGDTEEDDNDEMPSAEDTRLLVNSGWSGRTRAVGKYLQTLFDDQVGHGRKALSVDNLLIGKTRKEGARMFFETLVLKTKDYIQVEQEKPFDNIVIKPTAKLMKAEF